MSAAQTIPDPAPAPAVRGIAPKAASLPPASPARRFLRSVVAPLLGEMETCYGRSPGGYLWAVLEPLGGILLLSVGFSLVIHRPPLGSSFLLFYATGYMVFQLYQTVSTAVARSISFSRALLSYPAVSWFDAVVARLVLNSITGLVVTFTTISTILFVPGDPVSVRPVPLVEAMVLAIALGAGVGLVNCFLIGMLPVWALVWSILTRPLFIASGVILLYEKLSDTTQSILWWNPLIHIIGIMRTAFYPTYQPEDLARPYVIGVSLVLSLAGLFLLRRWNRQILDR